MPQPDLSRATVDRHYHHRDLVDAVLSALRATGKDIDALTPEDLAPVDEFHIRGRDATEALGQRLGLDPGTRVLDVGCGLGGPSRRLALGHGCRVTGLDLSAEYCRVARELARRLGLGGAVSYYQGDALAMPFADACFDVAWTQHAAMNIADKPGLYAEIRRVLRPGGRLAIYDVLAGPGGPVRFPVPWAREPSISHLVGAGELRTLLEAAGFRIIHWQDVTESGRAWFTRVRRRLAQGGGFPTLSLELVLGPQFATMSANLAQNLEEGRVVLAEVVAVLAEGVARGGGTGQDHGS